MVLVGWTIKTRDSEFIIVSIQKSGLGWVHVRILLPCKQVWNQEALLRKVNGENFEGKILKGREFSICS